MKNYLVLLLFLSASLSPIMGQSEDASTSSVYAYAGQDGNWHIYNKSQDNWKVTYDVILAGESSPHPEGVGHTTVSLPGDNELILGIKTTKVKITKVEDEGAASTSTAPKNGSMISTTNSEGTASEPAKKEDSIFTSTFQESTPTPKKQTINPNFEALEKKAETGDAEAEYQVGVAYFLGSMGVSKDISKATAYWEKAASAGNRHAESTLGASYHVGRGVPLDDQKAFSLFEAASEQGDPDAEAHLGLMYAMGEGAPKDWDKAAGLLRKALSYPGDFSMRVYAQRFLDIITKGQASGTSRSSAAEGKSQ